MKHHVSTWSMDHFIHFFLINCGTPEFIQCSYSMWIFSHRSDSYEHHNDVRIMIYFYAFLNSQSTCLHLIHVHLLIAVPA
jgi:hypothetical protein